jgi:hypothetical protein
MNRDQLHQAPPRCRFTTRLSTACTASVFAALLLVPAPLSAQEVTAADAERTMDDATPSELPPAWLAEACTPTADGESACPGATITIFVGTISFPDVPSGDGSERDLSRPQPPADRGRGSGMDSASDLDRAARRAAREWENASHARRTAEHAAPRFKCSSMGREAIKQSFLSLATNFFRQTGYVLRYSSAPDSIVAFGADRATSKISLIAALDLTLYRPGTIDGNVGCNLRSTTIVATQRNGIPTIVNNGHANLFQDRLRQHFIGI